MISRQWLPFTLKSVIIFVVSLDCIVRRYSSGSHLIGSHGKLGRKRGVFIDMADPKVSFVFMPTPPLTIADHKGLQYLPKQAFTSCLSRRKQTSVQETCQSPSLVFSWMKESRSRMYSAFCITWLVNYTQLLTHPFTRRKLKATVAEHKEAPLKSLEKEIRTR
jgi:hypothetical protein